MLLRRDCLAFNDLLNTMNYENLLGHSEIMLVLGGALGRT